MEVSCQLHAPVALPPVKDARYTLDTRLGGPQSRSGRCGVEENLLPLRELNPGHPACHYTD
jgi:hypothetical protein